MSIVYCTRTEPLAVAWYRYFTFFGVSHIAPSIYAFSVSWLEPTRRKNYIIVFGYLLFMGFYLAAVFTPWVITGASRYYWGYYPKYGSLAYPFLVMFVLFYVASLKNFSMGYQRETKLLKREQIRYIFGAYILTFFGAFDYLPKLWNIPLYPFGYITVFLWLPIVAYSIVRYRLMDIETVVHKTIMWLITSFLFGVPIILLGYFGKNWLVGIRPLQFSAITLGIIVLFGIYSRLVQPRIDHLFQRRQWDLNQVFEKFTDELVHLRELDELARHIVATIRQAFYIREISLFLSKDENSAFQALSTFPAVENRLKFERNHPFLSWLEKKDYLVLREYLDVDPKYASIREAAKEYFDTVNGQVCVPVVQNLHLLGVINIGQKANLKRFSTAEINFLSDVRRTAAIALSNSLRSIAMQESLRRWNVELEKKVEERTKELRETQAQLIQAEKLASIGTLAGGIAHEINNPLTAVLTNVQMLKMLGETADAESLSLIEEGAKRCQIIISKLMRYARKTEEVENYREVNVNEVIRNVCDFLEYQLKQENVDMELSLGRVDVFPGIPNELEQVFTNLILNARDAIKASGRKGKITIKTEEVNGIVRIEVADNGTGIKKEHLARIFDPFYTTKDVGEGTGLGLTISSGIIEKHAGKISVASEEGQGTSFVILFPNVKGKTLAAGQS